MKKLYLTQGEILNRVELLFRELPMGFAYGIEFVTSGTHPPYIKVWCDDIEEGKTCEWFLEDNSLDAETVLKMLNEISEQVNTICNAVDIFEEQPHYYDDEMPF